MKIFLLGYMGSGKSTIGKELAEKLKMDFIDFDTYIETKEKKSVSEIFEKEGEEKFRELEKKHLNEIIKKDNAVISLGGGTPCFNNNIETINKNGISIYLQMSVNALVKRLINAKRKRPLIKEMNEVDLKFFIATNLEKRISFYNQAKYIILSDKKSPEAISEEIMKKII
jgi:shikimate kinase